MLPSNQQKGTLDIIEEQRLAPFQRVNESIGPCTGNLNLLHTDAFLPGDCGLSE
jgi:hypothetical protein